MTDAESNASMRPLPFVHIPLPDSETHIRLLEVQQGGFEQHVVCAMSVWPLESAPPYSAISYTWGDPALTINITINGRDMIVRQNCEYTLQQTFAIKKKEKYVWVDAVCIDQTNVKERGHQVAIMGQLYRRAIQVFACVGPHADDSKFLPFICRERKHLLADVISAVTWDSFAAWLMFPDNGSRLGSRCILAMSTSQSVRLTKTLTAFLKRPYFSRVWVLQELFMGKEVVMCCGSALVPSGYILALAILLDCRYRLKISSAGRDFVKGNYLMAIHLIARSLDALNNRKLDQTMIKAWHDLDPQRGCLVLAARSNVQRPNIRAILEHIEHFKCADSRDRLYGILDMFGYTDAETPDYQKSTYEVACYTLDILATGSDGREAMRWAQHVATIFGLSPMDAFTQGRLRMRRDNDLSSSFSIYYDAHGSKHLRIFDTWHGEPILAHVDRETLSSSKGLYCSVNKTQYGTAVLTDSSNIQCVLAPPQTAAGDCFLPMQFAGTKHWGSTGMIIRRSESWKYAIVGLARQIDHFVTSCLDEFKILWHPEDILLLHLAAMKPDDLDIKELHSIRVCGAKNSSFVCRTTHEP